MAGRTLKKALVFFVLFFCCFQLPAWPVTDAHDAGGQAALEYWTLHHYQYGTQIVQNVGPLGFISYPKLYTGFLDGEKLALNIMLTALFVWLVMGAASDLPGVFARRTLLICVSLFAATWLQDPSYLNADVKLDLLMLLMAYRLFKTPGIGTLTGLVLVMALLSLAKGTLMHTAPAVIVIASMMYLLRGKYALACSGPAAYLLGMVFFWTLCGQQPQNLMAFASATLGLKSGYASGYTDSVFIFERPQMTVVGLAAALLAVTGILLKNFHYSRPWGTREAALRLGAAATELLILFIAWKHGFVRADGHTTAFFYFTIIAGTLFIGLAPPGASFATTPGPALRVCLLVLCGIGITLSCAQIDYFPKSKYCPESVRFCPEFVRNAASLADAWNYISQLKAGLERTISALQMPEVQKRVGDKGVGYFGFLPASMLYNHFDFRPMPNTISFTGWSHESMQSDQAFYRDDAAGPPFLLYKQGTIDRRIAAQDDALAQLEILKRYDPVLDNAVLRDTKDKILLQRRTASGDIVRERTASGDDVPLGVWVNVPAHGTDPVALTIHLNPAALSGLGKMLYKPSDYAFEYTLSNGVTVARKFMARMAEDGFLVAPLIDHNKQMLGAMLASEYEKYLAGTNDYMYKIVRFHIVCIHLQITCAKSYNVTFEAIHGLELGRIHKVSLALQ